MRSRWLLLLDYANVEWNAGVSLRDIIATWLDVVAPSREVPLLADVTVLAYGGWLEGRDTSPERMRAYAHLTDACPALVSTPRTRASVRLEFAERLSAWRGAKARDRGPLIEGTVGIRRSPSRFTKSASAECSHQGCALNDMHRWSRRGRACLAAGCPNMFGQCFERKEQKQVDVHLAIDLLTATASGEFEHVAIVSDDRDMLPAVYAACGDRRVSSLATVRLAVGSSYLDNDLEERGVFLIRVGGQAQ